MEEQNSQRERKQIVNKTCTANDIDDA